MSDQFASLIPDARSFLSELNANNDRDWFSANKARYDSRLRAPALALLDVFAAELGAGTGVKLFRPQRDIRFSKDKTPYHTHLHMLWTLPGEYPPRPGFFFGIGLDQVSVGAGFMGFDKDTLEGWRRACAGEPGAALQNQLDKLAGRGFRISDPELKRVPAPYDKDHAQSELLRRKSMTVWRDLDDEMQSAPLATLRATHDALRPLLLQLRKMT